MKTVNMMLNMFVSEDSEVSVETCDLGNFEYLEYYLDCVESNGLKSADAVLIEVKQFVEEKKQEWDDVDFLKNLDEKLAEFESKLNELIGNEKGCILISSVWAVEYDSNFGLMLKLYQD